MKIWRPTGEHITPEEYDRRVAHYSEMMFQRQPRQGELTAPMLLRDDQRPLMSMTNGKIYDSKSEMRKEYRRAGVIEVGDQAPTKRAKPSRAEKEKARKDRRAAAARALSKAGFGA